LADGHLKTDKSEICEAAERLNGLFAARKLPASRLCLLDRAHRQLRSANPLYRNDPTKESDEFKRVLARLTAGGRFLSGPETAEALTCRFLQSQEQGGAAGRRVAIAGLFRLLPDRTLGIVYLCEMAKTELFEEQLAALGEQFDLVFRARTMAELCLRTLAPKERMLRVTAAHHAVAASPYPEALKAGMLNHLDTILDRYVTEEQIIEKLDHAESSLRDRAVRLVQFCASGVLPEGKALSRARARILDLLRHPHFDAHFIDGITDPAVAQQQLRNFHGLLAKAGFR